MATDIVYEDKRAARGKFTQQGSFNQNQFTRKLPHVRLKLNERLVRQDLTIKSAVNTYDNYIISTIGEICHPDAEIAEFLNNNLKTMEDSLGVSWKSCLETAQFTSDWAGASVSEIMFKLEFGTLTLEDLITYHPSGITIYTDKKGRLKEGSTSYDGYHESGIYQSSIGFNAPETKLDLWKVLFLANDCQYGNYYGQSIVSPGYKWQRLKEALIDLMMIYLQKAGHRTTFIISPSHPTSQLRINPSTGEEEPVTTLDVLREQLESDEGIQETLLLPFTVDGAKPEVGSVPQSDLVGNVFLDAIGFADEESIKHICPYFLISDRVRRLTPEVVERRMEVFGAAKDKKREELTTAVIKQILILLVKWNFNRASAKIPPTFARVYSDRSEDRVATMQMVKGLTENGYLNPRNQADWNMVRQMVKLADRTMSPDDAKFIKEMLIEPRKKTNTSDVGPNGAGKAGRATGSTTKQVNSRSPQ